MLAEHQRIAAARAKAVLAARRGVILADEPGLGKSFVAAAIAAEAQRAGAVVEVIVPAGLVAQWCDTLRDFGVAAEVLTHDGIVSAPVPPPSVGSRLVIVDEAHAFRNPSTQRHAALARRTVGADVLLVTATPICNSPRDLQALLGVIAVDDALADCGVPSIDAAFARCDLPALDTVVSQLVIRRDRSVLETALQFGELRRSVVRHPVAGVGEMIDALEFPLVAGGPLLRRFLRRRVESSEAALVESVRRQVRFYERALESLAAGRTLSKRDYRRAFIHEEDRDAFQQVLFWDLWLSPSSERVTAAQIEAEMQRLTELRKAAENASPAKRVLLESLVTASADPVLVFTGSAATARDLFAHLRSACRCGIATARDGRSAIDAFRAGRIDVLVATDLAGEGLNLQRAGVVVHYDIPWNPVRLDQRNGRAFRIGQRRAAVKAVYFLPQGDGTTIVSTMAAKNRLRRRVLHAVDGPTAGLPTQVRPRVASDCAAARFFAALERSGLTAPEWLERRHRAGLEKLLETASAGPIDRRRLDDLLAIAAADRG
jgi:superfamily II DNA or RNA helicase